MTKLVGCAIVIFYLVNSLLAYEIPQPTLSLYRKGLEISIPHEEGTELIKFATDLKSQVDCSNDGINWQLFSPSEETWSWTYKNFDVEPKLGETFRYWIAVEKNGISYCRNFVVNIDELYMGTPSNRPYETSEYKIPYPSFRVYPQGFEVGIPHESGIEYVILDTRIESEIGFGDSDRRLWDIFNLTSDAEYWVYKDSDVELKSGLNICFTIFISRPENDYVKYYLVHTAENHEGITTIMPGKKEWK